jgi:hypothetical protein
MPDDATLASPPRLGTFVAAVLSLPTWPEVVTWSAGVD